MRQIENLLSRLDKVKPKGRDSWVACCPAHDDRTPSLVITQAHDGNVLIHCFAGCAPADILDSVGLEISTLFPEDFLQKHRNVIDLERRSQAMQRKKEAEAAPVINDQVILACAKEKRLRGEVLTEKELRLELAAFARLRKTGGKNAVTTR